MTFRTIAVSLTGDASSLGAALRAGAKQVDDFGNKVEGTNRRTSLSFLRAAGGATALYVAIKLVAAGLDATVGAAAAVETRMANVNSITHATDAQLRSLTGTVIDLSTTLPQSASTLADGLYDIASSGFQGAKGIEVLDASARAASAGLSTTATSAKAITAVLNAYGLSAASADDVSDSLFQTVNVGVLSFDDLAGSIGDVVGAAAVAGVNVNELGAAMATMTLSGISASESSTSLNRVIQSLLQPSDALATVLQDLGYQSGQQALQVDGLRGVMDKLRVATGGNASALLSLFPEMRAFRGAAALMSAEGLNYAKASDAIVNANNRQGATQAALNEQLKAASAQWQLFQNRAQAAGIRAGTALLPVLVDMLTAATNLGSEGLPVLAEGFHAVQPLAAHLAAITKDVVGILAELLRIAAPVAEAIGGIVGAAVLNNLRALAGQIQDLTDFLARNQEIVIALGATLLAVYVASLVRAGLATIAFNINVFRSAVAMSTSGTAARGFAADMAILGAGIKSTAAAMVSLQTIATAGLAAIIFTGAAAINSWQQAGAAADEFVQRTTSGFNALDTGDAEQRIAKLRKAGQAALQAQADTAHGFDYGAREINRGFQSLFGDLDDIARKGAASSKAILRLNDQLSNADANLRSLANVTGLGVEELRQLALANDIDLSGPVQKSNADRQKVVDILHDMAVQAGTTEVALSAAAGGDVEAMQALADASEKAAQGAAAAFGSATDIIANFDPSPAAGKLTDAVKARRDAERDLADLRARQTGKQTVSDEQQLADARRKVADATKAVSAAQTDVQGSTLKATYQQEIRDADQFADDLQRATRRGVDPQLIARLLQEGPEKAAPVLRALVADHSGRLIELANTSERKLREISERVVLFSRLTEAAIKAPADNLAHDLGAAMRITSETLEQGSHATVASVARALKLPKDKVAEIAAEFGITLQGELDKQNISVNVTPTVDNPGYQALLDALTPKDGTGVRTGGGGPRDYRVPRKAGGGAITGPGTGTSDSILIAASNDEHMLTAAEVAAAGGHGAVAAWRRMVLAQRTPFVHVPGYAHGGPVTSTPAQPSVVTVRVPVTETRTNTERWGITVNADSLSDIMRELAREESLRSAPDWLGG